MNIPDLTEGGIIQGPTVEIVGDDGAGLNESFSFICPQGFRLDSTNQFFKELERLIKIKGSINLVDLNNVLTRWDEYYK